MILMIQGGWGVQNLWKPDDEIIERSLTWQHHSGGNDYHDFYEKYHSEEFSFIINNAMPGTNDVVVDDQPQVINIVGAKVFGFSEK